MLKFEKQRFEVVLTFRDSALLTVFFCLLGFAPELDGFDRSVIGGCSILYLFLCGVRL